MQSSRRLVIAMAVMAGACKKTAPPGNVSAAGHRDPARCPTIHSAEIRVCPSQNCGGNSPSINGFPINGLHTTPVSDADPSHGCPNREDVSLTLDSLEGPHCESGAMLDVDGYMLFGSKGGRRVCEGDQLEGASFKVQ